MIRILLFQVIFCTAAYAQVVQPAGKLYVNTSAGGIVNSFNNLESEEVKHFYLNEEWSAGNLYFNTGQFLENYEIRYDYLTNQVEIKVDSRQKVVEGYQLDYFEMLELGKTSLYVNATKFGSASLGFYKVILSDTVSVLLRNELIAKDPSYVAALDVGDRDVQYYIERRFLMYADNQLKPIQKSRKSRKVLFGALYEEMNVFMKDNKLALDNEEDLALIFSHYNGLLRSK